jgi:hypothetical protein
LITGKTIESRRKVIKNAVMSMKERRRFSHSSTDYLYNMFCICKSAHFCCRGKKMHIKNRYKLFQKGEEQYLKEFDAEYFTSTMRQVHVLLASMMDEKQRFLSNYQQYNAI